MQDALVDPVDGSADAAGCPVELLFQRGNGFTNGQVYRVALDTFVEQPISNGVDTDAYAEWSPDGTKVAVSRNGNSLWVVDHDGTAPHQVDSVDANTAILAYPEWSPDGMRLAYTAIPIGGGLGKIYSAAATSTGSPVNLTPGQDGQGPMHWSPDGMKILFLSNRSGNLDVFAMSSNGTSQTNLTSSSVNEGRDAARWSPDGNRIVFVRQATIWVSDANGANPTNLSGTSGLFYGQPRWSEDGGRIYFVEDPGNDAQVFVMNANGTGQHSIDSNAAIDLEPIPSPDGTRVAWSSKRDGNFEIYVSNADGTNPVRVTNNPAPDTRPRWRPCL